MTLPDHPNHCAAVASRWPPRCFYMLLVSIVLTGCDAIVSHPAVPQEARQIIREGSLQTKALKPDVDRFLSGFRLASAERAAVAQMSGAMFLIFDIHDMGSFVRAAVEVRRAQLCLLSVGIEASGVINDLKTVMFRDEKGANLWQQVAAFVEGDQMPRMEGLICNG